jgi:hypothetical protein
MKTNKIPFTPSDSSSGVSELIGGILMIMVVVSAVAIIGVVLLSQPTPEQIPNLNFMMGTDPNGVLYLFHNGGDSLTRGDFSVMLDGEIRNDYQVVGGGNEWSLGKQLSISGVSNAPHTVGIIYNKTGTGGTLIRTATANVSVSMPISPDIVKSDTSLDVCAGGEFIDPSCWEYVSPTAVLDMFTKNVTENSIDFYKQDLSSDKIFDEGQYYTFQVADSTPDRSSITYLGNGHTPTTVPLRHGDVILITIDASNPNNFKTFGLTPSVWEFTGEKLNLSIKRNNIEIGPGFNDTVDILHTWVTSYNITSMHSSIVIETTRTSNTALVVNNSEVINGDNGQHIVLTNVQPCLVGLYLIQTQNNQPQSIYFVGHADSVKVDGVELNGVEPYCSWCS